MILSGQVYKPLGAPPTLVRDNSAATRELNGAQVWLLSPPRLGSHLKVTIECGDHEESRVDHACSQYIGLI